MPIPVFFHVHVGADVQLYPEVVYLVTEDNHNDTMLCAQLVDPELVERSVVFSFAFNPMSAGRKTT